MEVSLFDQWLRNEEMNLPNLENEITRRLDQVKDASQMQGMERTEKIERLFICMGMVKKVIESDRLSGDPSFLRHLLTHYDLPCSLTICELLSGDL